MSASPATAAPLSAPGPSQEEIQRLRFRRAMGRKKRKERELASEIRELNITAMMDMMTIILVFLLKSYSASSISMTSSEDIRPPVSSTRAVPRDTVAVTVTPTSILVGDRRVVALNKGLLPSEAVSGRLILPLAAALDREVKKLKQIEAWNPGNPDAAFKHELSIVGDKKIPYDLLLAVLYTAGQNELENYRFVVLQKEPGE